MVTRITWSTRPENPEERTAVVDFDATLDPAILPKVLALQIELFRATKTGYDAARIANATATAEFEKAVEAGKKANEAYDTAFPRWTAAVDSANHKGFAAEELRHDLGDQPESQFLAASQRTKVTRTRSLLVKVAATPALVGDPARVAALADANTELALSIRRTSNARRAQSDTARKARAAAKAFDKAWGKVVEELQDSDPAGLALKIPKFRRVSETPEAPAPAAPAACEPKDPTDLESWSMSG